MPTRVLLAEDDPIAREVLSAHLQQLGLHVDATASADEARRLGAQHRYDLLVLDQILLAGTGIDVLRDFRADRSHPNHHTVALAISAELGDNEIDALFAEGFFDAMQKPVSAVRMHRALISCGLLADHMMPVAPSLLASSAPSQILDDARAIEACGSAEVLRGLRELLAIELPEYIADMRRALERNDEHTVRELAHRLRSALGFCGASEMIELLNRGLPQPPAYIQFDDWVAAADRLSLALSRAASRGS